MERKKMAEKSNRTCHNIMLVFIKFVERGLSMKLLNDLQWQMTKMLHLFIAIILHHYNFFSKTVTPPSKGSHQCF